MKKQMDYCWDGTNQNRRRTSSQQRKIRNLSARTNLQCKNGLVWSLDGPHWSILRLLWIVQIGTLVQISLGTITDVHLWLRFSSWFGWLKHNFLLFTFPLPTLLLVSIWEIHFCQQYLLDFSIQRIHSMYQKGSNSILHITTNVWVCLLSCLEPCI